MNFVAHQIAAQNLPDDTSLLQKVLDYLKREYIDNETARQHSDREYAWLELLEADCIRTISFDKLIDMAEKAKCYRVVEHLLEKRECFDEILQCYLPDSHRHEEIWSYIQMHANTVERKIYPQCLTHLERLLSINADKMTNIVIEYFLPNVDQFLHQLRQHEKNYFAFVQRLLRHSVSISADDCERFLDLMCQFQPGNVVEFLRNNDNYRLEKALAIIKGYELFDSLIYLYEKQGDFDSAFNLSLELLREARGSMAEMRALELSGLCSRASQQLPDGERETLWFALIKTVLSRSDLTPITRSILHAASDHVDLNNLVQLVLNSGTKTGNFGDIKHLIVGMLANAKYEILLLQTTARVLGRDLHGIFAREKRAASRALSVKSVKCVMCRLRLCNQQEVLIFGLCGHGSHRHCLNDQIDQCPRCGNELRESESLKLAQPNDMLFKSDYPETERTADVLQLEAPPRILGGEISRNKQI